MVNIQINSQLLTSKEVMERLQINRQILWQLRKEGKIKAIKIRRSVRFTEAEIARFLNEAVEIQTA